MAGSKQTVAHGTLPYEISDSLRRSPTLWLGYQALVDGPGALVRCLTGRGYISKALAHYRYYRRALPDRDVNAWLAATHKKCRPRLDPPEDIFWYAETATYSVMQGAAPETVLACYFAVANYSSTEDNDYISHAISNLEMVMAPVVEMIEQGQFAEVWECRNPWSARNVPQLREEVARRDFWRAHDWQVH